MPGWEQVGSHNKLINQKAVHLAAYCGVSDLSCDRLNCKQAPVNHWLLVVNLILQWHGVGLLVLF